MCDLSNIQDRQAYEYLQREYAIKERYEEVIDRAIYEAKKEHESDPALFVQAVREIDSTIDLENMIYILYSDYLNIAKPSTRLKFVLCDLCSPYFSDTEVENFKKRLS